MATSLGTKTREAKRPTAAAPASWSDQLRGWLNPGSAAGKPGARSARRARISSQMLAISLSQLADLLSSGVPLLRSLEVLAQQSSQPAMAAVMDDVRMQVSEGSTLDSAFARHPQVFNELTVSMTRAGGEGGFLEDVLKRTADFIEQQEDIKGRVVGAATYPVILAVAGFSAVTVLIVFFVPKFAELFARLREMGELPFLTIALLWLSDTLRQWGWLLVVAALAAAFWVSRQLKTVRGQTIADRLKLRVPVLGQVLLSLAVARFCRVLGTLLKNGVPILRALEISSGSTGNRVLAEAIRGAAENISSGESLAPPLAACGLFPISVVEMIRVAEESNNLENVLVQISDGIDRRTQRQIDLMVRLLEPMMLMVMASVILVVVVALLLPVFQMSAAIN